MRGLVGLGNWPDVALLEIRRGWPGRAGAGDGGWVRVLLCGDLGAVFVGFEVSVVGIIGVVVG